MADNLEVISKENIEKFVDEHGKSKYIPIERFNEVNTKLKEIMDKVELIEKEKEELKAKNEEEKALLERQKEEEKTKGMSELQIALSKISNLELNSSKKDILIKYNSILTEDDLKDIKSIDELNAFTTTLSKVHAKFSDVIEEKVKEKSKIILDQEKANLANKKKEKEEDLLTRIKNGIANLGIDS